MDSDMNLLSAYD